MYYRPGRNITTWEPELSESMEWAKTERIWIKLHGGGKKRAICGLYMRTNAAVGSDFHTKNQLLYNLLSEENALLEQQGFDTCFMGDNNAWIKPTKHFAFARYPHKENNNGKLLRSFAESNNLFCLNPLKWRGRKEELLTYQRDMGSTRHGSIIDYVLASRSFADRLVDMKVTDSDAVSVDSDHSTLVISYRSKNIQRPQLSIPRNMFRSILKWESYKDLLDKRLKNKREWFKSLSIQDQGAWLTDQMRIAGKSVLPDSRPNTRDPYKIHPKRRSFTKLTLKRVRRQLRSAMNAGESGVQINNLKESWREARRASKEEDRKILIQKQQKIRKKISEKGPQGSKLFWQCINGKKKGSTIIEALDSGKGLEFDPAKKNKIIEDFFETKFQTSDSPPEQGDDDVREENIGIPPIKLSSTQSWKVTRIVSQKELDTVLDQLNVQKAEGPDEITTSMLKNSGPLARYMILELFNNVLLGGVNPKDWKVGNVILTLKGSNYRLDKQDYQFPKKNLAYFFFGPINKIY